MGNLDIKRTPLHAMHQHHGGRLIEFGGWEMPVQYTSIVEEHLAVRSSAGIFDISHMGELEVLGAGAAPFLDAVLTNDITKLNPGWGQYSLLCNSQAGVVDDLYVFQLSQAHFLLVVNASRIEADFAWLKKAASSWQGPAIELKDSSSQWGAIAVQGPKVKEFIDQCVQPRAQDIAALESVSALQKNQIAPFQMGDITGWISRTGYTGEDGFEVLTSSERIEQVWRSILETGRNWAVRPVGLGARDTLRLEACYPLYGHELDEVTTPLEAGLRRFVGLQKPFFTGQEVLKRQAAEGVSRRLIAFRLNEKAPPPRAGYAIRDPGDPTRIVGTVTSGTLCPSLGIGAGLGYVASSLAAVGALLAIDVRGRMVAASVVRKPLYPPH